MAQSKLELAVGTSQWDAGLKKAQQALNNFTQAQGGLQQALAKDTECVTKFVQMMGDMDSTANTAKGQLRDYQNSIEQLANSYNQLTDAQKRGAEGQAFTQAMENLKQKALQARQEVERLNAEMGNTASSARNIDVSTRGIDTRSLLGRAAGAAGFGSISPIISAAGPAAAGAAGVTVAIAGLTAALENNVRTATVFEKSMSGLSALTGMTGRDLDQLKEYAIELGSTTTLTASQVADAFRLIGSQQPHLLSSGEALRQVTKYAITLSEAAGIDLATASQTLSTSINQMGGDSANAARYVNVLAAASQKGAGDIGWLGGAVQNCAAVAKAAGTDFEELVANLEILAQGGYDASTAGTALRGIIGALEKQTDTELKPSVVGLTQAFENLGKKQLDIAGYQTLLGRNFYSQGMQLADNAQKARELTADITGTSIAEDQASVNTKNLDGALKSLSSAWEGLNLHINGSNSAITPFVNGLTEVIRVSDKAYVAFDKLYMKADEFTHKSFLGSIIAETLQWTAALASPLMLLEKIKALTGSGSSGGGEPSKSDVDKKIEALKSSSYKSVRYASDLSGYEKEINRIQSRIESLKREAEARANAGQGFADVTRNIEKSQAQLEQKRSDLSEYRQRGREIVYPKVQASDEKVTIPVVLDDSGALQSVETLKAKLAELEEQRKKAVESGNTSESKNLLKQINQLKSDIRSLDSNALKTGSTATTPQERARDTVKKAEQDYVITIEKAQLEVEAGTATKADAKKREMQATEQLWEAYGRAYNTYADESYKRWQEELKKEIIALGGQVKEATAAQEASNKAARELEAAQKKQAEAYSKMDTAAAVNDLKTFNAARKEYAAASAEVARLNPQAAKPAAVELPVTITYTDANLQAFQSSLKEKIANTSIGDELRDKLQAQLVDASTLGNLIKVAVENGIEMSQFSPQEFWQKIFGDNPGDYIKDSTWQEMAKKINEALKEHGIEITLNTETGTVSSDKKRNQFLHEGTDGKTTAKLTEVMGGLSGGMSQLVSGMDNLGVEVPQGLKDVVNGIQGVTSILSSINTIILAIEAIAGADAIIPFSAGGIVPKMATGGIVQKLATGGIAKAAGGWVVPGNFAIDAVPTMLTSGELVLNKAQQGVLASELEGVGEAGGFTPSYISGEQIWIAANRFTKRTGRGELVTWK